MKRRSFLGAVGGLLKFLAWPWKTQEKPKPSSFIDGVHVHGDVACREILQHFDVVSRCRFTGLREPIQGKENQVITHCIFEYDMPADGLSALAGFNSVLTVNL